MRFIHDNRIDYADSLTETSEAENYPVENIQDTRLSKQWITVGVTGQNVVIDAGSGTTITADAVAILGHNISSGATITIQAGTSATSVLSSPTTTETITYREDVMVKFYTSGTQRYWAITMEDSGNADGNIKIGRVVLGEYMEMDPNSLDSFNVIRRRNDLSQFSPGRQFYADEGVEWREFDFDFPRSKYASAIANVEAMYAEVGNHKPMVFCNFSDLWDYEIVFPVYCVIAGTMTFRHTRGMRFEYGLKLVEVK